MRLRLKEPERPLMRFRCPPGGGQGHGSDIAVFGIRQGSFPKLFPPATGLSTNIVDFYAAKWYWAQILLKGVL